MMAACCSPRSWTPPPGSPPPGRAWQRWRSSPRCSPTPRRRSWRWPRSTSPVSCGSGAPGWAGGPPARRRQPPTSPRSRCSRWTRCSPSWPDWPGPGSRFVRESTAAALFGRPPAPSSARWWARSRQRPAGRVRRAGPGGGGQGDRRPRRRGALGGDTGRLHQGSGRDRCSRRVRRAWPRSGSRSARRCCRCRGPDGPTRRRVARSGTDEVAVVETRRRPAAAAQDRRPGAAGHPDARGHHRPAPEVVEVVRALPPSTRSSTARPSRSARRSAPAVPGDRVANGLGQRRRRSRAVLLRPAAPRRRGPARPTRVRALRAPRPGWCRRRTGCPRGRRLAGGGRPGLRRRRGRRPGGGGASRASPRRTPPAGAARLGQGEAGAHPRPRGPRRGGGLRPPQGLALRRPPRSRDPPGAS